MARICILALIGLPAAGKTTFSRWLLYLEQTHFNIIHFCFDDFFQTAPNAVLENFSYKEQRLQMFRTLHKLINALNANQTLPNNLQDKMKVSNVENCNDYLIICDDNNYYNSMRYYYYRICKSYSCAYAQVYFNCNVTFASSRNAIRPAYEHVPEHILQRMSQRLEPPNVTKNDWESLTLTLSAELNEFSKDIVLPFILNAFEHILEPTIQNSETDMPAHVSTALQQLDICLRRRIKELTHLESGASHKQAKALALNKKRKEIMKNFVDKKEVKTFSSEDFIKYAHMLH